MKRRKEENDTKMLMKLGHKETEMKLRCLSRVSDAERKPQPTPLRYRSARDHPVGRNELKRMDHEFVDVVLTSMDFLPPTLMILLHSTAQYSTAAQYTCLIARLIETILCPTKYPGEISSRFLRGKFYHDDVMVE
ncbi:hypothetical protein RB195_021199 [Necator americanus]|uniref:Uncharacterized protein n=1 Tax=Necator americanus TaxID=51031 RepID=A0ABR1E9U5_NECAM